MPRMSASEIWSIRLLVCSALGTRGRALGILGVFSLHLIPEVLAFLLAAIAGGVVSRALIKEKWKSQGFRNVFKDATILVLISFVILLVAALLEAFVSTSLMRGLV